MGRMFLNVKVNVKERFEFQDSVGPMILIGRKNGRIIKLGRFHRAMGTIAPTGTEGLK